MENKKENSHKEAVEFCRETCRKSMMLLIGNLIREGVPKDKLAQALNKTETELDAIVSAISAECVKSRPQNFPAVNYETMRKDYLLRILVHYLKENESLANAVNFPRQSFKIFADAIRKLLGELIIEEKQLQCRAVVQAYRDASGRIDWDAVYVDERAKQICWDVLFRISAAISGLTGEWFKEYIADYARIHGSFYGEGMTHYVEERLESIAKMFR